VRLHQAAKVLFGRCTCGSGSHLNVTRPGEQVKLIGVPTQTAARLLERERELTELENALTVAQQGRGQVVLVEAPAGLGKTSLLRAASETAGEAGFTTLRARASELERDFAYGCVRQLVEPAVGKASDAERDHLFEGAAALSRPLFAPTGTPQLPPSADSTFSTLHGLHWRRWLGHSRYTGRWRETVQRSALTLKLLTYEPTGAIVAAPTTSLPERLGGERNWDYRYTWIRDAAFSLYALLRLGFTDEAAAFMDWLTDRFCDERPKGSGPLQIMYGIDGRSELPEEVLDHLEGYRGSRPVRVGNEAASQLQLDIYGELIDSVYLYNKYGTPIYHDAWQDLSRIVEWINEHWDEADEGIWETRGGRRDFTFSRLMSWVAVERAMRIARQRGLPANLPAWGAARDAIYDQIMARGLNRERGAFVQHYDTEVLDASILLMPLVKFIAPTDPRWLSTLDAVSRELVSDSLVYRYNPKASPDGLRGDEGTFSMCTFWYVEALARAGRLDQARVVFEKMLTYANHLGLYAEQIGRTGEQLGNFPQAFTHLALISAAINLDRQLG
jgi:GH15 family glucan-1,4-alpha-glucosidase